MNYLTKKSCSYREQSNLLMISNAMRRNCIEEIELYMDLIDAKSLITLAIDAYRFNIFCYIYQKKYDEPKIPLEQEVIEKLAKIGLQGYLQFLYKSGRRFNIQVLKAAIFTGNIHTTRFLCQQCDVFYDESCIDLAASMGYLDIIKFLVEEMFCPIGPNAIENANKNNDCYQYLLNLHQIDVNTSMLV